MKETPNQAASRRQQAIALAKELITRAERLDKQGNHAGARALEALGKEVLAKQRRKLPAEGGVQ